MFVFVNALPMDEIQQISQQSHGSTPLVADQVTAQSPHDAKSRRVITFEKKFSDPPKIDIQFDNVGKPPKPVSTLKRKQRASDEVLINERKAKIERARKRIKRMRETIAKQKAANAVNAVKNTNPSSLLPRPMSDQEYNNLIQSMSLESIDDDHLKGQRLDYDDILLIEKPLNPGAIAQEEAHALENASAKLFQFLKNI